MNLTKMLNRGRKFQQMYFYVGMIIVGLLFAVLGGIFAFQPHGEKIPIVANVTAVYGDEIELTYVVPGSGQGTMMIEDSGKVGETRTLYYDNKSHSISTSKSDFIIYLFPIIGIVLVVVGVYQFIKAKRLNVDQMNEYDQVNMENAPKEEIERLENSTEPKNDYCFHFDGHIKQGYIMEDLNKNIVYEAKMLKMTMFKPFTFEFVNHVKNETKTMQIGHTVSTSMGNGMGAFSYRVPISSSMKIDGVNNWKYLADMGLSFDFTLKGIKPCFNVKRYGVEIANVETAGTNAVRDSDSLIGKLPVNGIYNVNCRESDLEYVFMVCFSIARAIFYEN